MLKFPAAPGEGLQVLNFANCLHIALVIGKYIDVSRGDFTGGEGGGGSGGEV